VFVLINRSRFHRFVLLFHTLYVYVNNRNYRAARPVRTPRAPRVPPSGVTFRCVFNVWHY